MPLAHTNFSEALGPSCEDHSPPVQPEAMTEVGTQAGQYTQRDRVQIVRCRPAMPASPACARPGQSHRKIDADLEPFVKLPRTSDINGFVVGLLALLN
jgi:hypothetical protein